jgi:molybdopterin synthase catalytic subunit
MIRTAIVERPIVAGALLDAVASPAHGATALFLGTVREVNGGRAVTGIDYTAYVTMAEQELARIAAEAGERFGVTALVVEHRLGSLALGEVSVGIAAAHARRAPALDAMRWVLETLKARVPIWKREHYVDGTREWVVPADAGPPAGVDD